MAILLNPVESKPDLRHARGLALHARTVALLSARVCECLGLGERETRVIERAALLHDIGKLAIPAEILDKPCALDEDEWAVVRRHPVFGEAVVGALAHDPQVRSLVRHHHERWDGAGYPDALTGDAIPLGARVIAACDTFDAITSPRPYRRARGVTPALAEICAVAGTQLDPDVAAALVLTLSAA